MKKMKSNILSIAAKVVTVSECEKFFFCNNEAIIIAYHLCRQFHRYAQAEISVVDQELYFEIFEKEFGRILRNNVSDVQVSRISFQMPLNESRRALQYVVRELGFLGKE